MTRDEALAMRGAGTINLTAPMGMMAFGIGASLLRSHRPMMRTCVALLLALAALALLAATRWITFERYLE